MGVHKTVNGAYRYRYAPFLLPTYYVTGCSPLALPLGELSPQVTERVLQPFSNDKINLCAHTTKIPVDIPVGESQNLQPKRHQELRTFRIISKPLRLHELPLPESRSAEFGMRSQVSGAPRSRGHQGCCLVWSCLPSPSSLRSATSPKGRGKGCSHGTPKGV